MTVTYDETDLSTDLAQVRLKIGDVDTTTTTGSRSDWTIILTDEEIEAFLTETGDDVNLAAAYALRAIAASKAHLAKMVKIGDYSQDTKMISYYLNQMADKYEAMSEEGPAAAIAEQTVTDFAYRDIVRNYDLRYG